MKLYKTLCERFLHDSTSVDTSKINYSLSSRELSPLKKDLLEKVFKIEPDKPVEIVLREYNNWIVSRTDYFEDKVDNIYELQEWNFPWELVYEIVRKEFFTERPERSESYFAFNNIKDAKNWCSRRPDYVVCEIGIDNLISSFTGDMYYLDCVETDSSFNEIVKSIKKYWNGDVSDTPVIETLLQGKLKLIPINM